MGVAAFMYGVRFNNQAIVLDEAVAKQWGNVQSSYQRRSDLIPNLVNTAKGYAQFESKTLQDVINARASATQTTINVDAGEDLTPEKIEQFQAAQGELGGALSRLLATVEAYPDLKAISQFDEIQAELERTENRINVERNRYNETIQPYNNHIRQFPGNILAGFLGFDDKPYYAADADAQDAPEVEFNFED